MFCPLCRYEYKEGIKICADCKVELVPELPEEEENLGESETLAEIIAENEEDPEEEGEYIGAGYEKVYTYQNKKDKSNEFRSSGYVLCIVGALGAIFLILWNIGIIPLHFGNKIMMNIVLSILFLFFIIFGILSLKGARKYESEANEEENLSDEIRKFVTKNYDSISLDNEADITEEIGHEELLYFKRTECIKTIITRKFMNLSEEYVDSLIEGIYQEIYEKETDE